MRPHRRATIVAACLSGLFIGAAWADNAPGPKDQFQSVVFVRKGGAAAEMYKRLAPDTLAMYYPADFYASGGKYMYSWFNAVHIGIGDQTAAKTAGDVEKMKNDPNAYVAMFTRGMWKQWDTCVALGLAEGQKPANFDDLCAVPEEYAKAVRDGRTPLPPRFKGTSGYADRVVLCIANPEARRIMIDLVKFNAAHAYKNGPVNGGFIDLDCTGGFYDDYSEFARAAFDKWMRSNYTPEQVQAILGVGPGQPIPNLAPKNMRRDAAARLDRFYREWYWNAQAPEFCRELKEAIDSVIKPAQWHFIYHGDGYEWRALGAYTTNMVVWGDWMDSYCTECAHTPGILVPNFYAFPIVVPRRSSNPYRNADNSNNVYDYEYGAGRLWGEPVLVKSGHEGPAPFTSSPTIQLGLGEGLALLGNMRIDAGRSTNYDKEIPSELALPTVDFMHKIAPQERQMIPAAPVAELFSPADSYMFRGFDQPSNDTQSFQVSNILHAEHVPLQVVQIQLLERSLAERPPEALVLPWLKCVKDEQAATVANFVKNGGKAVFIGADCGTMTWAGLKRERSAFADLMPAPETGKVTFRDVGKGRTALIPDALDEGLTAAENLQRALFEAMGHAPSCVAPDQYPLLLTNLARNSDNSRFWMHLVNFNVKLGETDAQKPARPIENVRVVIPLPNSLRGRSATLYRPEMENLKLAIEDGREGCAVTVPQVDVYALVSVETEPGARPDKPLCAPGSVEEAVNAVARSFNAPPAKRSLVAVAGAPAATGKTSPRGLQGQVIAYAASAEGQPVRLVVEGKHDCGVYSSDGSRLAPEVTTQGANTVFTVKAPPAGRHLCFTFDIPEGSSRVEFAQPGGAVFEASVANPLSLYETGDSAPLYFYVPRNCSAFNLYPDTTVGGHAWILHAVVKDADGNSHFNSTGVFGKDGRMEKPIVIAVPAAQQGKVWSLWLLNAKGNGTGAPLDKSYVKLSLDGVPPVVANTPGQLLIAPGDE